MAQQNMAGLAVLVALVFAVLALSSCSSSGRPQNIAPPGERGSFEFHGAPLGHDALRSRLTSEG
jgi:hypothetical protein